MDLRRSVNGALAGGAAAALWAVQQPVDKLIFRSGYDDVEVLGKLVTRGRRWRPVGFAFHVQNGALMGAAYAELRHFIPGPAVARALIVSMAENFSLWPLGRVADRFHPARTELTPLTANGRALAQATWRHLLYGAVLGEVERRLNGDPG